MESGGGATLTNAPTKIHTYGLVPESPRRSLARRRVRKYSSQSNVPSPLVSSAAHALPSPVPPDVKNHRPTRLSCIDPFVARHISGMPDASVAE
jgi:hypothetical protein